MKNDQERFLQKTLQRMLGLKHKKPIENQVHSLDTLSNDIYSESQINYNIKTKA